MCPANSVRTVTRLTGRFGEFDNTAQTMHMTISPLRLIVAFFPLALAGAQPDTRANSLTPGERRGGWTLLFDGVSMAGWDDPGRRQPPGDSWKVENGWLISQPKPRLREDLVTTRDFGDFELEFEWRVAPGTNSGVKYGVRQVVFLDLSKMPAGVESIQDQLRYELANRVPERGRLLPASRGKDYSIGFEFQLIDDALHSDSREGAGKHATGALYDLVPPSSAPARPAGQINRARLVVRGDSVEHWINGVLVVKASLASAAVREGLAARWGLDHPVYQMLSDRSRRQGRISLTHHGDQAFFRNIRIREAVR